MNLKTNSMPSFRGMKNSLLVILSVLCMNASNAQQVKLQDRESANMKPVQSPVISFTRAKGDFPIVDKNLKKWDDPLVADLDGDGYLDLIINDHGFGISIYWNNHGRFEKPYNLIMGDLHGITLGDFDFDGNIEMIISRGGGSGTNARNSKMYRIHKNRKFEVLSDFNVPLELMRGRTVKFFDGDKDGDLDLLNFAFPDKEKNDESENYIYENNGNGELIFSSLLPFTASDGQKTLLTDYNSDGKIDLMLYGHGRVKVFKGNDKLLFEEVTESVLPFDIEDVTKIVEIDYDNDGDFDLYFTRGKEFEIEETFFNEATKTWGFFTKRGKFEPEDLLIGEVINIENYLTSWPNTVLHIGETGYEYEYPGETHSGKNIRLVNSDALGFPDVLSEKGGYIGYVGNESWRLVVDTWSPATGVIHGVASYPEYDHPKGLKDYFLENRGGRFIDQTEKSNLYLEEHTTSVSTADLDNNGWRDLVVIRRGNLISPNKSIIYLNSGNGKFKLLDNHEIISPELGAIGMCIETLDYNQDGKMDLVVGNDHGKWHLFKNNSKDKEIGNYLITEIGYSITENASALGALVSLSGCGISQTIRVGSTAASYSQGLNHHLHFGLGFCNGPFELNVTWSNGESEQQIVTSLNDIITIGHKAKR